MGAHYSGCGSFHADTLETAMDKAKAIIDDSLYEDGHGAYSGGLGTCRSAELVDGRMTAEEADKYVEEFHRKWDPMMVIQDKDDDTRFYYGGWCAC